MLGTTQSKAEVAFCPGCMSEAVQVPSAAWQSRAFLLTCPVPSMPGSDTRHCSLFPLSQPRSWSIGLWVERGAARKPSCPGLLPLLVHLLFFYLPFCLLLRLLAPCGQERDSLPGQGKKSLWCVWEPLPWGCPKCLPALMVLRIE